MVVEFSKHYFLDMPRPNEFIGVKIYNTFKGYPYICTFDIYSKKHKSGLPKNASHYQREDYRERNFHLMKTRTYLFPTFFEAVEAVIWEFRGEYAYPKIVDDMLHFLLRMKELEERSAGYLFKISELDDCIKHVKSFWKPIPKKEESMAESDEGWIERRPKA